MPITHFKSNHMQTVVVLEDRYVLHFGWPLCTRTSYKMIEFYDKIPRVLRGLQKYTRLWDNGLYTPEISAEFPEGIKDIDIGCGYISVINK